MKQSYKDYMEQKRTEYGDRFDEADIAKQFIPYFESGARIEVELVGWGYGPTVKRGTVGVSTGWRPVFLLMHNKRSRGSSTTLTATDKFLRVIRAH